ncbi:MAG TPA: glycosyltransferase [Puia sp.]|nr:glycosyltransferase [Puia sp.]
MTTPLISVLMITYNHEKYIAQAIEGVLDQRGDFRLELVIGNDVSKDATDAICRKYAAADPRVRYFLQEKNLGPNRNFLRCYSLCTGDYIALCEGDDEWIDENKLAKQLAAFREPDVVMSFTDVKVRDFKTDTVLDSYYEGDPPRPYFSQYDVFERFKVPTCTVLFRNILGPLPDWFVETHASAYFLFYLLSLKGRIKYQPFASGMYNRHYNGLSYSTNFINMLYVDGLMLDKLRYANPNDKKYLHLIRFIQLRNIDHLFHAGAFRKSISLFWKVFRGPAEAIGSGWRVARIFLKIHFLPFLSKRRIENYY